MMNLQIAKWGNSLAVRIPADYVRQIGVREGDLVEARLGAGDALHLACALDAKAQGIATSDIVMARNAKRLKLKPVAI